MKNGVKNIQATVYNNACTVIKKLNGFKTEMPLKSVPLNWQPGLNLVKIDRLTDYKYVLSAG